VNDLRRVRAERQARDDLVAHDRRRGRRAREHARLRQLREQAVDLHVLRSKVVAPLADAVRFIDRDQRTGQTAQQARKAVRVQALRRDVKQTKAAAGSCAQPTLQLFRTERRSQKRGRNATFSQRVHLILHERNERRNHQSGATGDHSRQLIHEALAAACGRDVQQTPVREQRVDRALLPGTER
jgi:hypothetical protein